VDPDLGLPLCPFAKPAHDKGRVKIVQADGALWSAVLQAAAGLTDELDVIVVVDDAFSGDYEQLEVATDHMNEFFSSAGLDLWALSHISEAAVIFLQRLTELDNSAAKLEKLGYYRRYSAPEYARLILDRRDRRSRHDARQGQEADGCQG